MVRGRQEQKATTLQRQYTAATALFAILVIGIIFLFGHLIARSLSKRYLEDQLIAGRAEAERLAGEMQVAGAVDLYDVLEKRREVLERSVAGLAQKLVFSNITVTDKDGNVIYTADVQSREKVPEELTGQPLEVPSPLPDKDIHETERTYRIPAPIGEVGSVVLSVSKGRLAERVVRLRRQLLRQTLTVAVVTLLTLVGGFLFVWHLVQRTRRLEKQRREGEELATLGTLAANLAHEIRNPLNSINLNLEMLDEDLGTAGDEARSSLLSTRREVGRLTRLVTDFLSYARPSESKMHPVELTSLAAEVADFLRAEARADGVHVGQADVPPERRFLGFDAYRKAFVTGRPGGTGLGLAIVERVAAGHGGRLDLQNGDPNGFVARLVLPFPKGDGKMGEHSASAEYAGRGRKR